MRTQHPPKSVIRATIFDRPLAAILDTGADVSILNGSWAHAKLPKEILEYTEHWWHGDGLLSFGGKEFYLMDKLILPIRCFETRIFHRFELLDFPDRQSVPCILGADILEKFGIISFKMNDGVAMRQRNLSSISYTEEFLSKAEIDQLGNGVEQEEELRLDFHI